MKNNSNFQYILISFVAIVTTEIINQFIFLFFIINKTEQIFVAWL